MTLPISKSQLEALGHRLVASDEPEPGDVSTLHSVLEVYGDSLSRAVQRLSHELGLAVTSRVKNTGTILEKLRRNDGRGLKTIQDLAGARLVVDTNRHEQNRLVARIATAFAGDRSPKIIDRRKDPRSGYRAVHIVIYPDDLPLELQVRTSWQHTWAELFEKLADEVGREIRYGGSPTPFAILVGSETEREAAEPVVEGMMRLQRDLVAGAADAADLIDRFEDGEERIARMLDGLPATASDSPADSQAVRSELERLQGVGASELTQLLDTLQEHVEQMARIRRTLPPQPRGDAPTM